MHSSTIRRASSSSDRSRAGVDALGQQVERERDQVDVAGALAVAEEAALDPLGAGHQPELGGRDRGAAVVVRMDGEDRGVPVREVADEPLHPIGVDVGRERLDRRRQVDDHPLVRCGAPLVRDRLADLERVVELRVVEALRRVLEDDRRARLRRQLLAELRAADGELGDAVPVEPEHDAPLRLRRRVVEVHDRALGAVDRLERALDQLRAGLREDRDRRVVGDQALLDEHPAEVEVRPGCGREADLDLLHAEADEQVEEAALAGDVHRVDEGLVSVAEVGRAPGRRAVDHGVRPRAVGQVDRGVGAVAVEGHRHGVSPGEGVLLPACAGARRRYVFARFPYRGRSRRPSASRPEWAEGMAEGSRVIR